MKNRNLLGLALALLAMPICGVLAAPMPSPLAMPVLSFWEKPHFEMREKRPWLNPVRAALLT